MIYRLREAVGGTASQQRAATALGIGGQVLSSLIVLGLVSLATAVGSRLFN